MNLRRMVRSRLRGAVFVGAVATFAHSCDLEKFVVTMITTVSGRICINTNLKRVRWNWSVSFVD